MKISVIVPIYNSAEYLDRCLNSLHIQEGTEYEFICVNDGSTDSSEEIIRSYSAKDSRFISLSQQHFGASCARNLGLSKSKGRYIVFVDSDDYILPETLDKLYSVSEKNDCDILVHGAKIFPENIKPEEWMFNAVSVRDGLINIFTVKDVFLNPGCTPFVWLHLYKKRLLDDNRIVFKESLDIGEDQSFAIICFSYAKKVLFVSDKCYVHCIDRNSSVMNTIHNDLDSRIRNHLMMIKYTQDCCRKNLNASERRALIHWALNTMYTDLIEAHYTDYYVQLFEIVCKWRNKILFLSKRDYTRIVSIRSCISKH